MSEPIKLEQSWGDQLKPGMNVAKIRRIEGGYVNFWLCEANSLAGDCDLTEAEFREVYPIYWCRTGDDPEFLRSIGKDPFAEPEHTNASDSD